jgi:uroporphyrinogen decarboxylase
VIKIDIKYPEDRIVKSRERLNSVFKNRRYLDQIPIQLGLQAAYYLELRNTSFLDYFRDAKSQVYHQLMNTKWRIENIQDDSFSNRVIVLAPDYQNIATAANFNGVKVIWDDKNPPRIEHFLHDIEDVRKLELPDVADGICGQKIKLLLDMQKEIKNYDVTLNGQPIDVIVSSPGTEGPFTDALDLIGEKLFIWLYEYPEDMKRLMDLLASALINFEKHIRSLCRQQRFGISITSDGAEMLSPQLFKEFVLPYNQKIFNEFQDFKELHMCGKIDHLIDLISEMDIDHFNAFGFSSDIKLIREKIFNKYVYSGGISPILLKDGTKSAIINEIGKYIDTFKDTGAYILGDGASIAPGTPLENLNLFYESVSYGLQFDK